jgi:hypothetical protein
MVLALSTWWYVGWVIAGAVVVIAATLRARSSSSGRIVGQADAITAASTAPGRHRPALGRQADQHQHRPDQPRPGGARRALS